MFYLVATILLNVIVFSIIKFFPRYGVNSLQAIVINYVFCVVTGSLFIGHVPVGKEVFQSAWFPWALATGAGFFSVFNLIAYSTKTDGLTSTTIANKLSIVIPVLFSVILYNEYLKPLQIAGIIIAFPAVYLAVRVKETDSNKVRKLFWPVLLFLSSGLLDTLVNHIQRGYLPSPLLQATYTVYSFATAGCIGLIIVSTQVASGKMKLHWRNVIAGLCLGIPNYFSIYFFVRMLNSRFLPTSALIPINNIGILVISSGVAILFFKEHASVWRIVGLVLSVAAIVLIATGNF